MVRAESLQVRQRVARLCAASGAAMLIAACGGGGAGSTGNPTDSGPNKTYLSVEATDADGDALQYQWRVSGGSIDNRNDHQTVWTMPDGPGLHFAYVLVSDGKGGYVEQQYAVSTDALGTAAPVRAAVSHVAPAASEANGSAARLRFISPDDTKFKPPSGGAASKRLVYLPDMPVEVSDKSNGSIVFSGLSDLSGEVSLPRLQIGQTYAIRCASSQASPLADCGSITGGPQAGVSQLAPALVPSRNLRLYGHIGLADGTLCGVEEEFFGLRNAATVQLLQPDGQALTTALRVNRFGDYALDAAVPVKGSLKLQVQCGAYVTALDVPASSASAGYVDKAALELSHQVPNRRPVIVKMVANGADGNVRGQMIVPEAGVASNGLPGAQHFLTYKGRDTRLSACMYYRALGAVKDCDAQGGLVEPISFEDWKRQNAFAPYLAGNAEVAATYINRMDLNLVRRMVATQSNTRGIAFYVCNHPGPDGSSQFEVDNALSVGLSDQKRVACVAMEWSTTPGVNGDQPFTKFFTFGPDGALLASINLDTRGEKYMPGACIACHGGTQYNGRFPEQGSPSGYLGAKFLPFDTGNYLFGSAAALTESAQSKSLHGLNQLVMATEAAQITSLSKLITGWYASGSDSLDKAYVPDAWHAADARPETAGAARFYREIIGVSCRTCHASLGANFDWDSTVLSPARAQSRFCGGTEDIANNVSMPNALISRDRIAERVQADPSLAALMTTFLGCEAPLPDPVYPAR